MRRNLPLALALAALTLAPATALAQSADEARIPPGAKAGGQDVGNLTLAEAAAKLDTVFGPAFSRDLEVRVAGKRFTVHTEEVGFAFDALKTARRANIAAQAAPKAPDGSVAVDVPLATGIDAKRLASKTAAIDARSTLPARDATVKITLRRVRVRPGRSGASLSAKRLGERIAAALANPAGPRILRGTRQTVRPKVRTRDLKTSRYATVVTIDQSSFRLRLFKRLKFVKSYGVAVGQPAYPTPNGLFSVANKAVNPTWTAPDSPWAGAYRNESVPGGSAENPLKARWMGIVNGVGIHGTGAPGSIGSRASHGCIRMTVPDVIDLYPRVPVGTPVLIGN
jgi:lipoprotein-anchoring transpeptidase ErfK/SrfK